MKRDKTNVNYRKHNICISNKKKRKEKTLNEWIE